MSIISIVWLVLAIVPIIITMIQVRGAEDPGSAGMVAFAIFFLAPFWALCITGWLALSPFILFLTGAVQSGWRLQRKEYILLGLSAAHVGLGLYTIYLIPNIIYYYQIWFFPWSL